MNDLRDFIRNVPDFPKKGIGFKDITTLLQDAEAFNTAVEELAKHINTEKVDKFLGIESRGFLFAAALAYKFKKGLILVRKPGKLPYKTLEKEYSLEYGTDSIEMHIDSVEKGEKIVIVDDLLATGGTAAAAASVVKEAGGEINKILFLLELGFLKGRDKLSGNEVISLINYENE
ncbi:adenine phosphoribosyltransferase [candidate division KSB1 bacterium]